VQTVFTITQDVIEESKRLLAIDRLHRARCCPLALVLNAETGHVWSIGMIHAHNITTGCWYRLPPHVTRWIYLHDHIWTNALIKFPIPFTFALNLDHWERRDLDEESKA
jgi:hypothetical protein